MRLCICLFIGMLVSCSADQTPAVVVEEDGLELNLADSVADTYTVDEERYGMSLYLNKIGPLELLESIKRIDTTFGWHCVISDSVPENWIKNDHLPALIDLMTSEELVYAVYPDIASIRLSSHGFSTIGREAHWMIQAFRQGDGKYLGAGTENAQRGEIKRLSKEEFDETMAWWETYQANR